MVAVPIGSSAMTVCWKSRRRYRTRKSNTGFPERLAKASALNCKASCIFRSAAGSTSCAGMTCCRSLSCAQFGELTFWSIVSIDPLNVAFRLWIVSGDIKAGERITLPGTTEN